MHRVLIYRGSQPEPALLHDIVVLWAPGLDELYCSMCNAPVGPKRPIAMGRATLEPDIDGSMYRLGVRLCYRHACEVEDLGYPVEVIDNQEIMRFKGGL